MNTAFERTESAEDWITPPELMKRLGRFDLDPCASHFQNEFYADNNYFIEEDGLQIKWDGRVWCNPPYGTKAKDFIKKMAEHNNGIVLIFARTDTQVWHKYIFPNAKGILFIEGRIKFVNKEGIAKEPAGAASALIAYGEYNLKVLESCKDLGWLVRL